MNLKIIDTKITPLHLEDTDALLQFSRLEPNLEEYLAQGNMRLPVNALRSRMAPDQIAKFAAFIQKDAVEHGVLDRFKFGMAVVADGCLFPLDRFQETL